MILTLPCLGEGSDAREIPRPAGEDAGLRDDAGGKDCALTARLSPRLVLLQPLLGLLFDGVALR